MTTLEPPACPPWCNTHRDGQPAWEFTRSAITRTCERRVVVFDGGDRHEYALQRFAAVEYGALRVDPPMIRVDDGDALDLTFVQHAAEVLLRIVELASEPPLAA